MARWAAVVCLLVVLCLVFSQATLVAYYAFEDFSGVSGYCSNTVPVGVAATGAALSSPGKFGTGVNITGTGYVSYAALSLFPGSGSSAFSVAAWVQFGSLNTTYQFRDIVYKSSFITFQLSTLTSSKQKNYALSCRLYFSGSVSSIVNTTNTAFNQTNMAGWTHVACTYNSTHLCVAYNGTISACTRAAASQISPSTGTLYASYSSAPLIGVMDELKFYDHGLTAHQLALLYGGVAANDIPTAVIVANASASALTALPISVDGSDARLAYSGASGQVLFYSWSILSSTCQIAEISNSSSDAPSIALSNVGSFVLDLCVTDGELSSLSQASVLVTASQPIISSQTEGPDVNVPLGYVNFPVSVTAIGVPAPTYQWQYLTLENANVTDNSTDNSTTLARRGGFEWDDHEPYYEVHWINTRAVVQVWNNIPGADSSIYRVNGTVDNNNQSIRCLITNSGGSVATDAYVILIVAPASPSAYPSNPSGTGGSSTNVGAIIGGVVGGGVGLLCLLLILVAVLAFLLARRRSGQRRRKLNQPDYAALAYGDVDDVVLPKKNAEHYEKLEKLLLAQNGRIPHAMFSGVSSTDAEKVAKAVMRVFEANDRGYRLLEQRISDEVALADEEGTLFRANSIAAKLFGSYVRMTSLPFIWFMLVTSVNSLNDNALEAFGDQQDGGVKSSRKARYKIEDDGSDSVSMDLFTSARASTMEIDPHKLDDASDTTINSLELWLAAQKLFKCIVDSERIMPTQIKQLMRHIDSEVGERFSSEAQFRALGGFLFLRMVCPALMAPQVYGLLDAPPHPVAQRQLILVSKVLQNLANDTLPGAKEAYMEQLNTFISTNKAGLERFYQRVVSGTERGKTAESDVPEKAKKASLAVLHRYIAAHLPAIEKSMMEDNSGDAELVEELKELMAQLGDDSNV